MPSLAFFSSFIEHVYDTYQCINHIHLIMQTGQFEYFDFTFVDCVLLAVGRNHSTNFVGSTTTRQIRTVHHDFGYSQVGYDATISSLNDQDMFLNIAIILQYLRDGSCAEYTFSITNYSRNGSVGEKSIYTYSSQAARYAQAAVPYGKKKVSEAYLYVHILGWIKKKT